MDAREVDLNLLLVLEALFEEGTLTRAAQSLHLSQPTASAGLARLRVILGDELFVRMNGAMQPTPRAIELRPIVAAILRQIRREVLAPASFNPASDEGVFTISMSDIGEVEFVASILERLATTAPRARLRTRVLGPTELVAAMEEGQVDLALGYFPDLISRALMQQVLFRETSVCLVRRGHPQIGPGMTRAQFSEAQHLAVTQQGRHRDVVELGLEEAGIQRHVVAEICHFSSVPWIIAHSDLISTIPRPLAERSARLHDLVLVEAPFPIPPIEVRQFWHRRFDAHPRLKWLRRFVAEAHRQPAQGS